MILYFTATGNSKYVADKIASTIKDNSLNLFKKIQANDYQEIYSDKPWIIVAPTYAWRIPRILENWLEKTTLLGSGDIYFVMTCGGSIGNASKYLKFLCEKKGLNYLGCYEIIMPENYIAMFNTPTKSKALEIIAKAEVEMDNAINYIQKQQNFSTPKITLGDRINSGPINILFYPLFVHAKKFHVTDSCINCGLCQKVCPLNNIQVEKEKPIWNDNCTHCMACICKCPQEAIEYGKHSKGLPRYNCPK